MPHVAEPFTWRDGERTIHFGDGAAGRTPPLLDEHGFAGFTLMTTARARGMAPAVVAAADAVVEVPPGKVDELSAALLGAAGGRPLVALGGGRVIDTAKAIAGATDKPVATLATTLSGAELTRSHRRPVGVEKTRIVRPSLVVADPELMASAPEAARAASAMNALAHALEALYTPYANPVCELAALRGAELLARGVEEGDRDGLALGALLAGYACGATGVAVHHAVCQTIVRTAGSPHAETNAVMLPHSARLMVGRAPGALGAFAQALGDPAGDPEAAPGLTARLAAHSGHTRLRTLGVEEGHVDPIVTAVLKHPLLGLTPDPPDADELRALVMLAL
jgi:alcohol dehydrogenase class IV